MAIIRAYHGTVHTFNEFHLGEETRGNDQEGPGFYFTSDSEDAARYADRCGVILSVDLALWTLVPTDRPARASEIRSLIRRSPFIAERLADWDENPAVALEMAVDATLQQPNAHQAFLAVSSDFYGNAREAYLEAMRELGYDGVTIERTDGITHFVVFSPDRVTIVAREPVAAKLVAPAMKKNRAPSRHRLVR